MELESADDVTTPPSIEEDSNAEEASCELFNFVVSTVVLGLICAFGLAGNITSFFVLCKHKTETATVFLLQCMAVFDSLLLVFTVFVYVLPNIYPYTGRLQIANDWFDKYISNYVWPPALILHTITIWLTVLVTVDRYCAVCRAVQQYGSGSATLGATRRRVAAVVTLAIVYNSPRFFEHKEFGQQHSVNSTSNYSEQKLGHDVDTGKPFILGDNQIYQIIYSNILYFPVMYLMPLGSLAYLNVKLISALKAIRRKTTSVATSKVRGRKRRKDDHITQCVVAIVCVFIVCQTPALLNQIFFALSFDRECGDFHFYYTALSDVVVVVNSSCNFVIYCLFGATFRRIFLATVCSCCGYGAATANDNHPTVAGGPRTTVIGVNPRQSQSFSPQPHGKRRTWSAGSDADDADEHDAVMDGGSPGA